MQVADGEIASEKALSLAGQGQGQGRLLLSAGLGPGPSLRISPFLLLVREDG